MKGIAIVNKPYLQAIFGSTFSQVKISRNNVQVIHSQYMHRERLLKHSQYTCSEYLLKMCTVFTFCTYY